MENLYSNGQSTILRFEINEDEWNKFLLATDNIHRVTLEKRPYIRFICAEVLRNILGLDKIHNLITKLKSYEYGGFLVSYPKHLSNLSNDLKIATAFAFCLGAPQIDELTKKYYAEIDLTPKTKGDSFLSEPFHDLRLHTDGTFYQDSSEWVMLSKITQNDLIGGELSLHHIQDISNIQKIATSAIALSNFKFQASESKKVMESVCQPIFFKKNNHLAIRFSDQFCHPENFEQAKFIHDLSDNLEQSKKKIITDFPTGQLLILNNSFWLHGRLKIVDNEKFNRKLLRMRGIFYKN